MAYTARYRNFSDEALRQAQIDAGRYLDKLHESKNKTDKLQIGNARRRYWRILDEIERRKMINALQAVDAAGFYGNPEQREALTLVKLALDCNS